MNSRRSCAKRKTRQQNMIFSTRPFFHPRLGRRNRRVHRNTQYQMAILTTCTQGPETHLAVLSANRSKAFPKHQVAPLRMLGGMFSGLTGPQIYLNQSCFAICKFSTTLSVSPHVTYTAESKSSFSSIPMRLAFSMQPVLWPHFHYRRPTLDFLRRLSCMPYALWEASIPV